MNLSEAKGMAAANSALPHILGAADKAQARHSKIVNAMNSMKPEDLKNHPINQEHSDSVEMLKNAKTMATDLVMKHAGADVETKKAEAEKMGTETEMQKAQAKEADARANVVQGIADRHDELINTKNVERIFHPPAPEQQGPLAGAKKTAKNISAKPAK